MNRHVIILVFLLLFSGIAAAQIDLTIPSAEVTHNPKTGITAATQVSIRANASDTQSGVRTIEIIVDNTVKKTCSFSLLCTFAQPYSPGAHSYKARATDNSGNSAITPEGSFTVTGAADTSPPTVAVQSRVPDASRPDEVEIAATASDMSGIKNITIFLDGTPAKTCEASLCSLAAAVYPEGTHKYYAVAYDFSANAGRDPASGEKTFIVSPTTVVTDTTSPAITSLSIQPGNPTTLANVSISLSASDSGGSNLALINIFADDSLQKSCASSPCSLSKRYSPGNHTYNVTASDNAGNTASVKGEFSVTDRTPPDISISHSPQEPTKDDAISITAVVHDESELKETKIFLNKELKQTCMPASPCSFSSALPTGQYNYSITATDIFNNTGENKSSFFVNDKPVLQRIYYTGSCSQGSRITVRCVAADANQPDKTLDVRLWAGQCERGSCFSTRSWTSGTGVLYYSNAGMTQPSTGGEFTSPITINQPAGTSIAATCIATDNFGARSNYGDAYALCDVGSACDPPTFTAFDIFQAAGTLTISFNSSAQLSQRPAVKIRPGSQAGETSEFPAQYISDNGQAFVYSFDLLSSYKNGVADLAVGGVSRCGATGSGKYQFIIDTVVPEISASITPANPLTTQNAAISATASDANSISRLEIYVDDTLRSSCNSFICATSPARYSPGTHRYRINAYDRFNNLNSLERTFSVGDTSPPTIYVSHSSPGISGTVTITATASDEAGIKEIKLFVDDLPAKTCASSPCAYTNTYGAGSHAYNATAKDNSDNYASSGDISFIISAAADTTPPNLAVQSFADAARPSFAEINATAYDAGGINNVKIYVDGAPARTCSSSECSLPFASYAAGQHNYYATATDTAGNTARHPSSGSKTFAIAAGPPSDTTPPSLSASVTSNPTTETTATITATASDAGSGIRSIDIYADDSFVKSCPASPCSASRRYPAGTHTYNIIVYDNAGNSRDSSNTFTVADRTAPLLSASHSPASPRPGNSAIISVSSSDESGLRSVALTIVGPSGVRTDTAYSNPPYEEEIENIPYGLYRYNATSIDNANNANRTQPQDMIVNTPPSVQQITYTGNCNIGETITVRCTAVDADMPDKDLTTKIWAAGSGRTYFSGAAMTRPSADNGEPFTATLTINQPEGTGIAVTCRTKDTFNSESSLDAALCTAGGACTVPRFSSFVSDRAVKAGTSTVTFVSSTTLSEISAKIKLADNSEKPVTCALSAGIYSCNFAIEDNDANGPANLIVTGAAQNCPASGTSAYRFTVDTTPPQITASARPANPTMAQNVVVSSSASDASGVSTTEISIDGTSAASCDSPACETTAARYSAGSHNYLIRAVDILGNTRTASGTFTVADTIPPTVSVSHSPQNPLPGQAATITATADDLGGIKEIKIFANGAEIKSCNSSPCSDTRNYAYGSYSYYAQAKDNSDNPAATTAKTFLANTPPSTVTSARTRIEYDGINNRNERITLKCFANDPDQKDKDLTVQAWAGQCEPNTADDANRCRRTASWKTFSGRTYSSGAAMTRPSADDGEPFTASFTINQPRDTGIAATCLATDALGTRSDDVLAEWRADAYPLIVVNACDAVSFSITAAPAIARSSTTITLTASKTVDTYSAKVKFADNSEQTLSCTRQGTTNSYSCPLNVAGKANGLATVEASGTSSDCPSVGTNRYQFTIDTTLPEITHSTNPASPTNQVNTRISASASDTNRISKIEIYVDSTLKSACESATCATTAEKYSSGNHNYEIKVTDKADNLNTTTVNFAVRDTILPRITSFTNTPASPKSSETITLAAVATDPESGLSNITIELRTPGSTAFDVARFCDFAGAPTTESCSVDIRLVQGTYTFRAKANDTAGNEFVSAQKTFSVTDDEKPEVSASHAPTTTITTADDVTITATATDAGGSGLRKIEIFVDSSLKNTCTSPASPCSSTLKYSYGEHSYRAKATDNRNNFAEARGTFAVTDTTAPVLDSASVNPSNPASNADALIRAVASDAESKIAQIRIFVDALTAASDPAKVCDFSTAITPATCETIPIKYTYGQHEYYFIAKNSDGDEARFPASGENTFNVADADMPSLTIAHSPASPKSTDPVTVRADATDSGGSGLKEIIMSVDGAALNTCRPTGNSAGCEISSRTYSSGRHDYTVTAEDNDGNKKTETGSFIVNDPPTVSTISYSGDCKQGETITIQCYASDANDNINNVYIWAGECQADCFNTKAWATSSTTDRAYYNGTTDVPASTMTAPTNTEPAFTKTLTIIQPDGTGLAAKCQAIDSNGVLSRDEDGDAYPLCVVGQCSNPPRFTDITLDKDPAGPGDVELTFKASKDLNSVSVKVYPGRVRTSSITATKQTGPDADKKYTYKFTIPATAANGVADTLISGTDSALCTGETIKTFVIDTVQPSLSAMTAPPSANNIGKISLVATASDTYGVKEMKIDIVGGPPACGTADEGSSLTLSCPAGQVVTDVTFASYGTPSGTCGSFSTSGCHAPSSLSVVKGDCLNRNSCTIRADNDNFGDPCVNTVKQLFVQHTCGTICTFTTTQTSYTCDTGYNTYSCPGTSTSSCTIQYQATATDNAGNTRTFRNDFNYPPLPDLVVENVRITPENPVTGSTATITADIKNAGHEVFNGKLDWCISVDSTGCGTGSNVVSRSPANGQDAPANFYTWASSDVVRISGTWQAKYCYPDNSVAANCKEGHTIYTDVRGFNNEPEESVSNNRMSAVANVQLTELGRYFRDEVIPALEEIKRNATRDTSTARDAAAFRESRSRLPEARIQRAIADYLVGTPGGSLTSQLPATVAGPGHIYGIADKAQEFITINLDSLSGDPAGTPPKGSQLSQLSSLVILYLLPIEERSRYVADLDSGIVACRTPYLHTNPADTRCDRTDAAVRNAVRDFILDDLNDYTDSSKFETMLRASFRSPAQPEQVELQYDLAGCPISQGCVPRICTVIPYSRQNKDIYVDGSGCVYAESLECEPVRHRVQDDPDYYTRMYHYCAYGEYINPRHPISACPSSFTCSACTRAEMRCEPDSGNMRMPQITLGQDNCMAVSCSAGMPPASWTSYPKAR